MSLIGEVTDIFFNRRKAAETEAEPEITIGVNGVSREGQTSAKVRSETIKDIVLRSPCKVRIGTKYYLITATEVEK